ncbi:MAG: tyrosine-type recombinase/integrase [Clostridia bacterium]|nr:tyrosine-type recombinase/integrase [Clostridia bacterium]
MRNKGGSIKQLKNGKWLWTGYYIDENGKEHRPNRTYNTEAEAEAKRKEELELQLTSKRIKEDKNLTVKAYYEYWVKTYWDEDETNYKITTTTNWQSLYNAHLLPVIGNHKIDNIGIQKLNEYFVKLERDKKTKNNIKSALMSMLKVACYTESIISSELLSKYENGIIATPKIKNVIATNKTKAKEPYKPKPKVFNVLLEEEYQTIIKKMLDKNLYYANAIIILYETGLRAEELAFTEEDIQVFKAEVPSADYGSIDINKCIKRTRKTTTNKSQLVISYRLKTENAYRKVPLNSNAIRAIERQLEYKKRHRIDSPYVFCTKNGNLLEQRLVLRSFHETIKCLQNEGKEINIRGLHSLRKLFCKRLRDLNNTDWEKIKTIMGHSSSDVTKKNYYSIADEQIVEEALKMNLNTPSIHNSIINERNDERADDFSLYDGTEILIEE